MTTSTWACRDCDFKIIDPAVISRCPQCGSRRFDPHTRRSDWPKVTIRIEPHLRSMLEDDLRERGVTMQRWVDQTLALYNTRPSLWWGRNDKK